MVYFAILVSDCKLMVEEPNFRVAWSRSTLLHQRLPWMVRESVYRKLKIGTNSSASSGWRSMRMNRSRQKAHSRR